MMCLRPTGSWTTLGAAGFGCSTSSCTGTATSLSLQLDKDTPVLAVSEELGNRRNAMVWR